MIQLIAGVAARGALNTLWHFVKDAVIEGVAAGIANVVAWRVEDLHDRAFKVGDYKPDNEIVLELEEPCEPGCTCEACAEQPAEDGDKGAADDKEGGEHADQ